MYFIFLFGYTISKRCILRREYILKLNRKIIWGIILLLILSVLGGCKNKIPKTPENFDQDLWRDSVEIMDVLYTTIEKEDNFSVEDENRIEEYLDTYQNRFYNNMDEYALEGNICEVYNKYVSYLIAKTNDSYFLPDREKEFNKAINELQQLYEKLIK